MGCLFHGAVSYQASPWITSLLPSWLMSAAATPSERKTSSILIRSHLISSAAPDRDRTIPKHTARTTDSIERILILFRGLVAASHQLNAGGIRCTRLCDRLDESTGDECRRMTIAPKNRVSKRLLTLTTPAYILRRASAR